MLATTADSATAGEQPGIARGLIRSRLASSQGGRTINGSSVACTVSCWAGNDAGNAVPMLNTGATVWVTMTDAWAGIVARVFSDALGAGAGVGCTTGATNGAGGHGWLANNPQGLMLNGGQLLLSQHAAAMTTKASATPVASQTNHRPNR